MRVSVHQTIQLSGVLGLIVISLLYPAFIYAQGLSGGHGLTARQMAGGPSGGKITDTVIPAPDSVHLLQAVKVRTTVLPQVLTCIDPVQIISRKFTAPQ